MPRRLITTPDKNRKAGTDGAMVRQFLASKGYSYPTEVAYARMVYLTDASRQKELMIIFMDDYAARQKAADTQICLLYTSDAADDASSV